MSNIGSPYLRIALVWVGMIAIWLVLPSLQGLFWDVGQDGYSLGGHMLSALLATVLAVPMVVVARRLLDGRSVVSLGLDFSPTAFRLAVIGALAFLLPSALGFAIVFVSGWSSLIPMAPLGGIIAFVPVLIVLVFLFEALPEELAFRGYMQSNLEPALGHWGAVFAQAALFSLWVAALWTLATGAPALDRVVMFFFVGLVLGLVRSATGSVWTSIGLHVAFQTVAQLVLNTERGHFRVEGTETLQLLALGVVPFSLALLIVEVLKGRTRGPAA